MTAVKDIFSFKILVRKILSHQVYGTVFMANSILGPCTIIFLLCLNKPGIMKKSSDKTELNCFQRKYIFLDIKKEDNVIVDIFNE